MTSYTRFELHMAGAVAFDDGAVVLTAAALACAAGALQYSVSSGDKGISAFLSKEKRENPFYQPFAVEPRKAPRWLAAVRLPRLDFVEVYGQASRPAKSSQLFDSSQSSDVAALYAALDDAIGREDYVEAAACKRQIDALLLSERDDQSDPGT